MDLSFVTERILALSFPPDMNAASYREALHQAAGMLQTKHGDNYMVYNFPFGSHLRKFVCCAVDLESSKEINYSEAGESLICLVCMN